MSQKTSSVPDLNSWFEDELRQQYQHDHRMVDESWKEVFDGNGGPRNGAATASEPAAPAVAVAAPPQPAAPVPPPAKSVE